MSEALIQMNISALSCLLILVLGIVAYLRNSGRSAEDVLEDLGECVPDILNKTKKNESAERATLEKESKKREEFSFLSTLSSKEIKKLKFQEKMNVILGCLIGITLYLVFLKFKLITFIICGFSGLCFGYLYSQRKLRVLEENFKKEIIFYLPVVMERIVMAVQAGLDILPALKVIEEIERSSSTSNNKKTASNVDAVTKLLAKVIYLCESGLSFEQALRDVANSIKSNALRHSFIHLAVAQKEGGELIYPLRELSDATQLYFQESVEEHIAKMPVKATMPLLLTFAGLIISFMTGPVIQVLNVSANPRMLSEKANQHQESHQVKNVVK